MCKAGLSIVYDDEVGVSLMDSNGDIVNSADSIEVLANDIGEDFICQFDKSSVFWNLIRKIGMCK